jgi:hypothetical protein
LGNTPLDDAGFFTAVTEGGLGLCRLTLFLWASARIEEKLEWRGLSVDRRSAMGELGITFSSSSSSQPERSFDFA